MPAINKVSPAVFEQPAKRRGRRLSPEMLEMVERIGTIRTERDAFEVLLVGDEKAATVRAQIVRAARIAGVDVAIRRSDLGYYVGLMTPERRGRPGKAG
ncbi:MAG: hypothetical protein R3C32_04830 [Chloroflexota bacterium]